MNIVFLGTGTSTGVPQVGCTCKVCTSSDPRDNRLRCAAWIETDDKKHILIDCGPDFRQAMLREKIFQKIDALLLTHEHYDHVGGLDDLRPFCRFGDIPVYANALTSKHLCRQMPYCFVDKVYPGIPRITMTEVIPFQAMMVGNTEVLPLEVMHGQLPILGYRIGQKLGYITDAKTIPQTTIERLKGIDTLIINTLRPRPHNTHMGFEETMSTIGYIRPRQAFLIHMSHEAGLHAEIDAQLPEGIHFAYDGLKITC